jgi:DNA-directed RNA polymerase specialized sigma24 family protein
MPGRTSDAPALKGGPVSVQERRQIQRIRRAIAAMPDAMREIYLLHLIDGLSYDAIAARLAIGPAAVEEQIAQAIVFLDRALRAGGESAGDSL